MNHLFVFTACLLLPQAVSAARPATDASEACPADTTDAEIRGQTSLLQTSLQITKSEPDHLQHSSKPKQSMTEETSKLDLRSANVEKKKSSASGSAGWFSAYSMGLLQHARSSTGNAAVVTLIMLISLGVCLILVVAGLTRNPQQQWTMPSAENVVLNSFLKRGATPDTRLPSPSIPGSAMPPPSGKPATAPDLGGGPTERQWTSGSSGSGIMSFFGLTSSTHSTLAQAPLPSTEQEPIYLMPELLVPDPEGAQFFIDGLVAPEPQSGFLKVSRISADRHNKEVLSLMMCEEASAGASSQGGILVELPSRGRQMPLAFMNTEYALRPPAGHGQGHSRNRHITMFAAEDTKTPFAIVEREPRGVTVRRSSGQVLCIVLSGGYNTDFGNITDERGRLIATMSNRGHSLTGLGRVPGAWTENRKVVQIAQGVDMLLIVLAIISATKLREDARPLRYA